MGLVDELKAAVADVEETVSNLPVVKVLQDVEEISSTLGDVIDRLKAVATTIRNHGQTEAPVEPQGEAPTGGADPSSGVLPG